MRIYATADDLAAAPWYLEPPTDADRRLATASRMVDAATRLARYTVDNDGMPTDTHVVEAMRDAVCAQVAAWDVLGIDPAKGAANEPTTAPVASKGLGSAQISYDRGTTQDRSTAQQARATYATSLAPEAWAILAVANLTNGQVWTYG